MFKLLFTVLVLYALHRYRQYWLNRQLPLEIVAPFEGRLYQVGDTIVAKRCSKGQANRTIICMPGFLEDMRYFTKLYENAEVELILINNANYQNPFAAITPEPVDWGVDNPYEVGTIAHDAVVICEVIKRLATTKNILIHGHSRGAASVFEAGKQQPELMKDISTVLEAPIAPQGTAFGRKVYLERLLEIGLYFLPLGFAILRILPPNILSVFLPLSSLAKDILLEIAFVPKQYATALTNIRNLNAWHNTATYELYDNFKAITVVIGEKDAILSRHAMLASAKTNPRTIIIETQGTNHFISAVKPEIILEAVGIETPKQAKIETNSPISN